MTTIRPCCAAVLAGLQATKGTAATCRCGREVRIVPDGGKRDMRRDVRKARTLVR